MLNVPTTCPFCACGCGLYLVAEQGELVGVAPSEAHPVSSGRLCARGWGAHEAALWGNRLKRPRISKAGVLETASWAEALDYVTERIKDLVKAGKPVGILGSPRASNEENYLACKLARAGLRTNNIDSCFRSLCAPLLEGLEDVCGEYIPSARVSDIEQSEAILLIEGDLARTHPCAASGVLRAMEKGVRLVTVGYVKTQMAGLASLHLETNPGDEGEVTDSLLAAVLDLGLEDRGWVALHCDGYDALRRTVSSVPVTEEARQAAEWLARAKRAVILVAPTVGPPDRARKNAAGLATLAAITGHLRRLGSGLLPLLPRSNARGAFDMGVTPDYLPGHQPLFDGRAKERLQDLWVTELPPARGLDAERLVQSVSGLVVLADDPPSVLPMGQRALEALGKVEFLVVLDAFETPTSRQAHAVLPIACFAETDGTVTNMEGRVQEIHAATNPPGEARPGWQVLAELCTRFELGVSYRSAADVLKEISQAGPQYARIQPWAPDEGWGGRWVRDFDGEKCKLQGARLAAQQTVGSPPLLVRDGVFDWDSDPFISFAPNLNRDSLSKHKLFPKGFVEIRDTYAVELGIPAGRQVKLTWVNGHAVFPVRLRPDLKSGVLLVPYAFRDHFAEVLGAHGVTEVKAEQA